MKTLRYALGLGVVGLALVAPAAGLGQSVPLGAKLPVQVFDPTGEFAKKLHGAVMPTGKGWKTVTDPEKRFQIMVPDRWKTDPDPNGEAMIRMVPPGSDKEPSGVLMAILTEPRDSDPLEVEQPFAATYAEDLARDPALAEYRFKPTDSGFVVARGLKFALAGGTMVGKKNELYQQEQLVYISEDRVVSLQFTARLKEFPKLAEDVARIFASYQNLATRKSDDDPGDTTK